MATTLIIPLLFKILILWNKNLTILLSIDKSRKIVDEYPDTQRYLKAYYGSAEFIKASPRVCIWVEDHEKSEASQIAFLKHNQPGPLPDIIKEATDQAPSIKKAGGGLAYMLGE